jgi:two-component system, NarL family, sensor histidine kinase UhpB
MKHLHFALPLLLQVLSFAGSAQQSVTDSLLTIVRQNNRDKAEARALNALAVVYSRTDMAKAMACLYEAIAIGADPGLVVQLSASYDQLVVCKQDMGEHDSALFFLDRLKRLSESHPDLRMNYSQAAGLFYKKLQDFGTALPFLQECLQLSAKAAKGDSSVANLTTLAGSSLNVGNTVLAMGDYKAAQRYHLDALRLFERVGNKKGIAYCYQMVGNNFVELNQSKQALIYIQKSLALKTELNDIRGTATSLQLIGAIFRHERRYDSALVYDVRALEINERLGLKIDAINMDLEIGNIYRDKQNDSAAERYYSSGREIAVAAGDTARVATFDAALIAVRNRGEDQFLTEQRLMKSVSSAARSHDATDLLSDYDYLAQYYARTGQAKKAVEYLTKYYEVTDSMQDLNTQVQLRKMEGQYNVEKKEGEIALLKKDQQLSHANLEKQKAVVVAQGAVLKQQKLFQLGALIVFALLLLIGFLVINRFRIVQRARRAIELEKMRNHIARDLHDDIGSTLSSINILSKVALKSPSIAAPQDSLAKIRDRSAAIMEKMDDIVWTINPQNDTMEQLLYRMKEFAAEMLEPLNIDYHFEEAGELAAIKLDIRKRKDFYLLFKEAVNNAAKYSQCSHLFIRLRQDGDSLRLEITDDGKGFSAGTTRTGNGLNNMHERASSMLAKLSIESTVGQGTRIGLDLPIT